MVNIHGRRCQQQGCDKQPTFGRKGQKVRERRIEDTNIHRRIEPTIRERRGGAKRNKGEPQSFVEEAEDLRRRRALSES